jgi:hypothetical protein
MTHELSHMIILIFNYKILIYIYMLHKIAYLVVVFLFLFFFSQDTYEYHKNVSQRAHNDIMNNIAYVVYKIL